MTIVQWRKHGWDLTYVVGIVLAVNSAAAVGVERRQDLDGSAAWLQTWFSLGMTRRQESGKDSLVCIRPEGARRLVGKVSLVFSDLCLSTVGWFR